jgi:1,4-alpha-glucan branching enzyme
MTAMKRLIPTALLGLAMLLTGCAGGLRGGAPPGAAGGAAPAAPAAKAAAVAKAAAGGVTFVWKGEGASVALAGEFNGWNTTADPMTRQADGTWTLTKKLEPGRYMYKFVLDGTTWKEDPAAKETTDDGYGGKNSVVVVGGGAAPAAASAKAAAVMPAGQGRAPVQTPDGVVFTFAGAATSVALAGDFNAWAINADPLAKQADGTWTLTKKLAAGAYEYKFVVDGTTWKTDEANPASKADPYGGKNSLVTVK